MLYLTHKVSRDTKSLKPSASMVAMLFRSNSLWQRRKGAERRQFKYNGDDRITSGRVTRIDATCTVSDTAAVASSERGLHFNKGPHLRETGTHVSSPKRHQDSSTPRVRYIPTHVCVQAVLSTAGVITHTVDTTHNV